MKQSLMEQLARRAVVKHENAFKDYLIELSKRGTLLSGQYTMDLFESFSFGKPYFDDYFCLKQAIGWNMGQNNENAFATYYEAVLGEIIDEVEGIL